MQCEVNTVELGFNRLDFNRFDYATHDQLPLAVDVGVGHFLLTGKPVRRFQRLDSKSTEINLTDHVVTHQKQLC